MCLVLASSAGAEMVIDEVTLVAGPARTNGVWTDYYIEAEVQGSGIASVSITFPVLGKWEMFPNADGSSFQLEGENYDDLADIRAQVGFGDFIFDFVGTEAETDTVTVYFDPGDDDLTGWADITSPEAGSAVDESTPFTWTCQGSCGDEGIYVALDAHDSDYSEEALLDATERSWSPPGFPPTPSPVPSSFTFAVSVLDIFAPFTPTDTVGGRTFDYASAFISYNEVTFVPEPAAGASAALLTLAFLARHRRRSLGRRGRE